MRVENPRFTGLGVMCPECPLTDKHGEFLSDDHYNICINEIECPHNMEEYTAACLMAEEAAKGGKG
jgi:hypothetical protein